MDHDGDVIWVVEGRWGAIKRGIVEAPFGEATVPISFAKSCRYLS
jgi:hypothetical protein